MAEGEATEHGGNTSKISFITFLKTSCMTISATMKGYANISTIGQKT